MNAEVRFYTEPDLTKARTDTRKQDAHERICAEATIISLGKLVSDLIRFTPEGLSGEALRGYEQAVRDVLLHAPGCTMVHDPRTGELLMTAIPASVPMFRVDEAIRERDGERRQ